MEVDQVMMVQGRLVRTVLVFVSLHAVAWSKIQRRMVSLARKAVLQFR
jgi:hypothetical protein